MGTYNRMLVCLIPIPLPAGHSTAASSPQLDPLTHLLYTPYLCHDALSASRGNDQETQFR